MAPRQHRYSAKQWLGLGGLVVAALLFSILLRKSEPLGVDIGGETIAGRVLADERSPQQAPPRYDLSLAVYTDYRCPSCRASDEALERAAAQDGQVRVIYKEWPIFGEQSLHAAQVALAARKQGLYREVRARLMAAPQLDEASLRRIVTDAGGDWPAIERDLLAGDRASTEILTEVAEEAFALGLPGTPAYLAGPILVKGALDEDEFLRLFEQARAASAPGG